MQREEGVLVDIWGTRSFSVYSVSRVLALAEDEMARFSSTGQTNHTEL